MRSRKWMMVVVAAVCLAAVVAISIWRKGKLDVEEKLPERKTVAESRDDQPRIVREIPRQEGGFFGQVVDVEGNGLPGVTVEAGVFQGESPEKLAGKVFVWSTATDSQGKFSFREREPFLRAQELLTSKDRLPEWRPEGLQGLLVASKEGYFAARKHVDFGLSRGPHQVVLNKSPEVSGRVVWKDSRQPIPRVQVLCQPQQSDVYQSSKVEGQTDRDGYFSLTVSAEGDSRIWPQLGKYYGPRPERLTIPLVPGERIADLVLEVDLLSQTIIEGTVMDAIGGPIAGASVQLSTDKSISDEALSGKDGHYLLVLPKDWPYQSYFVDDWPEKPEFSLSFVSSGRGSLGRAEPKGESKRELDRRRWDWANYWTPPPQAPPERLLALHPDYEIGVVDVPLLGIGQVRSDVDVVLYQGTKVSGRVLDDSSEPLEGAKIIVRLESEDQSVLIKKDNGLIRWEEITSGKEGSFEIRFLREGGYELTAYHEDCDSTRKQLALQPHQVVDGFDFVLVKRIGFIRGRVLDHSSNPWPRGKVKGSAGHYAGFDRTYEAAVRENGSYELSNLKAGDYNLWLDMGSEHERPEGILQATALRDIPTGTEGADIIVTELPAGSLRVRVMDSEQRPIERFFIRCSPLGLTYGSSGMAPEPLTDRSDVFMGTPDGKMQSRALSSRDSYARDARCSGVLLCRREVASESGELVAARVAPGQYFVSVKTDNHPENFKEVEIVAGRETEVTFELEGFGSLEGIVIDERGQPLEGIKVSASKLSEALSVLEEPTLRNMALSGDRTRRTQSDEHGEFSFGKREWGTYRVLAESKQGRSAFDEVTVEEGSPLYVRLVFQSGTGAIGGYVCGEDGRPLTRAMVTLEGNGQRFRTETDEQASYLFSELLPGRYQIKGWVGPMGRWGTGPYRSHEIELAEGERVSFDILAWGNGAIEGTISLAGDAARAVAWFEAARLWGGRGQQKTLVLREITDSEMRGAREMGFSARDAAFSFPNVPAGRYEVQAYFSIKINPEPIPILMVGDTRLVEASAGGEGRTALFASEPVIVDVVSGTTASVNPAISHACFPHYPIPDPETCEKQSFFVSGGN